MEAQTPIQDEESPVWAKKQKVYKVLRLIKRYLLLGCWVAFTALLILFHPVRENYKVYCVSSEKPLSENIPNSKSGRVAVHLIGPFTYEDNYVPVQDGKLPNLQVNITDATGRSTPNWKIHLVKSFEFDTTPTYYRTYVLDLGSEGNGLKLNIESTDAEMVSFGMDYSVHPVPDILSPVLCISLLVVLIILLALDLVHRTLGMIFISSFVLALMAAFHCIPPLYEIVKWIDFETMLVIFGMTIITTLTKESGLMDFLAVRSFELSHGHIWPTMNIMMLLSFCASALISNIPVVMLCTPFLIRLCEIMGLDPVPVLICHVISSNLGAILTPYGEMPDTIIAENEPYIKSNFPYMLYLLHIFPGVLLAMAFTYLQLRLRFMRSDTMKYPEGTEVADLRTQIRLWKQTAAKIAPYTDAEQRLHKTVMARVRNLRRRLERLGKMPEKIEDFETKVKELKQNYPILSKRWLITCCVVIGIIVVLYGLRPVGHNLSLGWITMCGALLLIILVEMEEHIEPLFLQIEWATLIFIAAVYVLAKALDELQFFEFIARGIENAVVSVHPDYQLLLGMTLIMLSSAMISSLVSGIPTTTMAMHVIHHLAENKNAKVPVEPLIWSLTYGISLGGMGTLIGSVANIVVAGITEKHGHPFFYLSYFRVGFPVMIVNVVVALCYLYIAHIACKWH